MNVFFGFLILSGILLFFFGPDIFLKIIIYGVLALIVIAVLTAIVNVVEDKEKEEKEKDDYILNKTIFLNLVEKHIPVLYRKKTLGAIKDEYGFIDTSSWQKSKKNFLNKLKERYEINLEEETCLELIEQVVNDYQDSKSEILNEVPSDPYEYEKYCANILNNNGWSAQITSGSGDHGVDVIAEKNGQYVAIQCKLYNSKIGNKAVQEVASGMKHWNSSIAVVVTNSDYTKNAIDIARTHNVHLLHHSHLPELHNIILSPPVYKN